MTAYELKFMYLTVWHLDFFLPVFKEGGVFDKSSWERMYMNLNMPFCLFDDKANYSTLSSLS